CAPAGRTPGFLTFVFQCSSTYLINSTFFSDLPELATMSCRYGSARKRPLLALSALAPTCFKQKQCCLKSGKIADSETYLWVHRFGLSVSADIAGDGSFHSRGITMVGKRGF
ncbi:MAG: hypothetical protein VKK04_01860, partial [Synechococcales bacterium]|nr:hypothetical protein [Synechococcales bacterium]